MSLPWVICNISEHATRSSEPSWSHCSVPHESMTETFSVFEESRPEWLLSLMREISLLKSFFESKERLAQIKKVFNEFTFGAEAHILNLFCNSIRPISNFLIYIESASALLKNGQLIPWKLCLREKSKFKLFCCCAFQISRRESRVHFATRCYSSG